MVIVLLFISCLVLLVLVLFVLLGFFKITAILSADAPFIPTPSHIIDGIIENFYLTKNSVLYDLGCGDARVIKKAAELNPQIKVIGIEIAFIPFILAKFFTRKNKQIEIRRENFFKTNLSDATHIFLYLYPKAVNKLIENIKKQCAPGTIIVSCDFEIMSCKPINIININNEHSKICQRLFVYSL